MKKGLTVIELVLALAALVILLIVVPPLFGKYVAESRDIRRVAAIHELQAALKNYYLAHSNYPAVPDGEKVIDGSFMTSQLVSEFFLVKTHLPVDPYPVPPAREFFYTSNGNDYVIEFCLVAKNNGDFKVGCENKALPLPVPIKTNL